MKYAKNPEEFQEQRIPSGFFRNIERGHRSIILIDDFATPSLVSAMTLEGTFTVFMILRQAA